MGINILYFFYLLKIYKNINREMPRLIFGFTEACLSCLSLARISK